MNESTTPPPAEPEPTTFQDRRTGLKIIGVLQGLMALLVLGLIVLMLAATAMIPTGTNTGFMLLGAFVYGVIGAVLLVLGAGAWSTKRWGVALGKAAWGLVLFTGAFAVLNSAVMLIAMPDMFGDPAAFLAEGQELPENAASMMRISMLIGVAVNFVFLLLIPLGFFLFYRSRHVYLTAQYYDPNPSWADHVATPVLAAAILAGWFGLMMGVSGVSIRVAPLGATTLTGAPAVMLCMVVGLLLLLLAWGLFRQHPAAWYGAWAWLILMTAFQGVLYATDGYGAMMEAMFAGQSIPEGQIALSKELATSPMAFISGAVWVLFIAGYLLYIRRYFFARASDGGTP